MGDETEAYWEARLAKAYEEMQAAPTDRDAVLIAFAELAALLMEMRYPQLQTS